MLVDEITGFILSVLLSAGVEIPATPPPTPPSSPEEPSGESNFKCIIYLSLSTTYECADGDEVHVVVSDHTLICSIYSQKGEKPCWLIWILSAFKKLMNIKAMMPWDVPPLISHAFCNEPV